MVMSPQRQSTVPQIVIDAVNRGWSIFPVDETKKPPLLGFLNKKGEPARLAWKQYQKERASVEQIIQWQNQFNPSGWAVITGAISKLIILDGDGEPGRNTFEGLGLNPHRRTGSGGFHVDFEHPGWHVPTLNSKSKIELGKRWPGLDIRADGGYAVFCGRNESGQYEWLREPGSLESLNILPDTLRDFLGLLCPPGEKLAENSKLNATPRSQSTRWGSARCSVADIALEKYLGEASLRGRDNACFDLACQLRDNNYSQSEAENYCMEFARRTHTSNQKGQTEPFTEADACAKVASAFSYSAREPWTQQSRGTSSTHTGAEQKGTTQPNETEDQATSIVDKAIEDKDLEALLSPKSIAILAQLTRAEYTLYKDKIKGAFEKRINLSDLNSSVSEARKLLEQTDEKPSLDIIADDFADKHKEDWAFNALSSAWYQWTGTHWQNMQDSESQKKSCVTLDRIVRDLMRARDLGINKSSDLDCVVRLAAIHCKRSFVPTPGVVNFRNGTLEVSTGTLRAHDRDDQLTYCLPYDYEVHGQWPAICKFLQELFPDKYARQNFMVHIGLSLMSDNKMHYSGAIIGPPRVGKSTALDLANITCGISEKEYAGKTLFNPDLEGKRTRYMQNKKRIVCIDELPVAALRNEETVKNMMAHSGVEMRGMMRDEELDNRWRPKIFMAMNEKPEYKDTSGAIKERIVPLMVGSTRPKDQRDLQLLDKMKPELGGFAASCIRLALAALKRGYYPLSGAMKAVINEMEAANNPLKSFIQEECILDPEGFIFTDELYELYKSFCSRANNIPLAKYKMSNELTQMGKGITRKRKRNDFKNNEAQRGLVGIRLRTAADPELEDTFEDDDPILVVDDVDDMLTTFFKRRQQAETASEAASDTLVDDVNDIFQKNACREPIEDSDKQMEGDAQSNLPSRDSIVSNKQYFGEMSSTSSTNTINQPLEPHKPVDDVRKMSSTCRQRRQQKIEIPKWLIPGTPDWDKLVDRVGLKEANERRQAALAGRG